METTISKLVSRFERGALTRRELIQGLTMLTAAGAAAPVAQGQNARIQVASIDHVSIQVSDLPRAVDFYRKMFGMPVTSETKEQQIVRLGTGRTMVSLSRRDPAGIVDHFAIGIESFDEDRVAQELRARGANPQRTLGTGFHITDPDGIPVQVVQTRP